MSWEASPHLILTVSVTHFQDDALPDVEVDLVDVSLDPCAETVREIAAEWIEWVQRLWNAIGEDMLWSDDVPPESGVYLVLGRLVVDHNSGVDGEDFSEEFEVDEQIRAADLEEAPA